MLLIRAAKRGVKVRVLFGCLGQHPGFTEKFFDELRVHGGQVKCSFSRCSFLISTSDQLSQSSENCRDRRQDWLYRWFQCWK